MTDGASRPRTKNTKTNLNILVIPEPLSFVPDAKLYPRSIAGLKISNPDKISALNAL
jgi:hypothetical protein